MNEKAHCPKCGRIVPQPVEGRKDAICRWCGYKWACCEGTS